MKSALLILIFITANSAHARWVTKDEAGSVIENYIVDFNVNKDGSYQETVDYTTRVQAEDAKVSASLFNIEYNSVSEKVEILEAYTLNGKEKIPVEPTGIEDRDKGEAKDYDSMRIRSVVFPQVQIGSKLHVRYTAKTLKPEMVDRWSHEEVLGPSGFIEKLRITVKSQMPIFAELKDPRGLMNMKQKDKNTIEFSNKKVMPGWVAAEKEPYFHPASYTYIRISTQKDWALFFANLSKDYSANLEKPLPKALQAWVATAKKKPKAKDQILFLMERMSREFRYFGDWRRVNGGIVPRTLEEIEKSRYGDCKDLASILVAMLRALKIDANLALVRRGENAWGHEPDYDFPDMARFNHAIAQAKVDGEVLWLDATNPVSSLKPFPDIAGRPAWLMQPPSGHFERLPDSSSEDFLHLHDYEYTFKSKDVVTVKVNAQLKNLAAYHIANELLMAPRSEVLTDTLEYFAEGQSVNSYHYLKEPTTTRAIADMNVGLEYQAGRVTYDAGKDAFFVIPDGFLTGPFYETENRESDIRLGDTPFLYKGSRRLKDSKLKQDRPENCKVESEWMDLERRIAVEGKDVVIYQNVNLKRPVITHADYRSAPFRKLQKDTKACFFHSGILVGPQTGTL